MPMASPPPGDPARPRATLSRTTATFLAFVLAVSVACSGSDDAVAPLPGEESAAPPTATATTKTSTDRPDGDDVGADRDEPADGAEQPTEPAESIDASDAGGSTDPARTLVIDEPATVDADAAVVDPGGATPEDPLTKDVARSVAPEELPEGFVPGVEPVGFDVTAARIIAAGGDVCEVCLWLAGAPGERSRGLRGVTDLGAPVGMLFAWDEPSTSNFVMFETPTPLSIAWFDESGAFVAATDMEPCLVESAGSCTRYRPDSEYRWAIEVVQGELEALGIGPGARLDVLGPADVDCSVG